MIALMQGALPALVGLLMIWAGIVALAGQGGGNIRAEVLVPPRRDALTPERTLHVMHFASLTLAAAVAGTWTGWWLFTPTMALLRVVLVALLVWAIGDLVPRLLAELAPELVPHVRRMVLAVSPVFLPLLWMARRLDFGAALNDEPGHEARAESTHEMAMGVFSLKEMTVAEVMTPRIDIFAVHDDADEPAVIDTLRRSEHARLLVVGDNLDEVVGIVYAKDMLPRMADGAGEERAAWQSLIRPAAFVPEGKTLERQLRDFQRGPGHIAVVVDEYGGTAGLVTLEDILEQIVGEIQDEYDDEVAPLTRHDDGHLTVQGGVALADLEAEIEHDFEREDIATVGGLVFAELGRVPRIGDTVAVDGWRFAVELVLRRRVRRVSVWPPPDHDEAEGPEDGT